MKKHLSLFLAAVLLLFSAGFSAAPAYAAAPEEPLLGIISAMDSEIALLLGEMETERVDTVGGVDYSVGTLHGRDVVVMRSGIGKVRAASAATVLLNRYPVSSVIFTGIAGAVGNETQILDEVIGTRLVQHDYGTLTNDGFVWTNAVPGEEAEGDGYYESDPGLVKLAAAAGSVLGPEHVFLGTVATGDQFVASEDYVLKLQRDFDAVACEMEGAAVAAVCTRFGIPFVVLRAMSDKADGNASQAEADFGTQAAENSSRIVLRMLDAMQG